MRKAILVPAIASALMVAAGAPSAWAAPPAQETVTLDCSNGQTYEVAVNGNGAFTPGRVLDTQQVLVPTSFGDFLFTAVLPDGTVIQESEPGSAKGGGNVEPRSPRPLVTCTFEESETLQEDDPESGLPAGTVLTFGGSVTGFLTGR